MTDRHFPITPLPPEVCDSEYGGCGRVLVYEMGINAMSRMHYWCSQEKAGPKGWKNRCPYPPKEAWKPEPVELKIPTGTFQEDNPCGWLARNGKFYGCTYSNHETLASALLKHFYDEVSYIADELRKKGWVYIGSHGIHTADKGKLTKRQKDVLLDLYLAGAQDSKAKATSLIKDIEWEAKEWGK